MAEQCLQSFKGRYLAPRLHAGSHATLRHRGDGILADDGNMPDLFRVDGQQVLVLEQYDGPAGHLQGCRHLFGIAYRFLICLFGVDGFHRQSDP